MPESGNENIENKVSQELQRPSSRREVLKRASAGFAGLMSLYGAGSFGRDIAKGDHPVKGAYDLLKTIPNNTLEGILPAEKIPFSEDPFIREIEERLGIRLVTIRQAYQIMGYPFDEQDPEQFAESIPMRWDHERAQMISDYFTHYLPQYFHEPDKNGNPLMITLTNFADDLNVAADYHMDLPHNFMRIDYDCFTRQNEAGALKLLAHECIHYMQDQGYSRLESIFPTVSETKDITKFSLDTISWLDSRPENESIEDLSVYEQLRYGVQDILGDDPTKPRDNLIEFEAVLGEYYLYGREDFISKLSKVYGAKAETLYNYMRDNMFGGEEYDRFPILNREEVVSNEEFLQAINVFNLVSGNFIRVDTRDAKGFPFLNPNDEQTLRKFRKGDLNISRIPVHFVATDEQGVSEEVHLDNVTAQQNSTPDNKVRNRHLYFLVDKEGNLKHTDEPTFIDKSHLLELAKELFVIPPTINPQWSLSELEDKSPYALLTYIYNGYQYEMSLHETGRVICRMNEVVGNRSNTLSLEQMKLIDATANHLTSIYGSKMSAGYYPTEESKVVFFRALTEMGLRLNPDNPNLGNQLAAIFAWESGFSPKQESNNGSDGIGLIQFTDKVPENLGTSHEELRTKTPLEQLAIVERYFRSQQRDFGGDFSSLLKTYLLVINPGKIDANLDEELFPKDSDEALRNRVLDKNGDGVITVGEAIEVVRDNAVNSYGENPAFL